ncbi:MAG: hypothetical protein LC723_07815, partial [Actinobacteria bacterium]|nr:hypothetical protein [Actinomycetota bacterium]
LHINAVTPDDGNSAFDNTTPGSSGKKSVNPLDTAVEDLWDYNELGEELPILHRNICKYGDYYMMIWPVVGDDADSTSKGYDTTDAAQRLGTPPEGWAFHGPDDQAGDPVETQIGSGASIVAVDMICHEPLTTRAFYDPENPRKMTYVIRSWEEGQGQELTVRANLYYSDRIERYVHKGRPPLKHRSNAKYKWEQYTADGAPAILSNPFDQIPFFHYRTDRTYGKPDHFNAYGPQLAINKIVTSHLATVDYQSFPQRYALTDPTADPSGVSGTDNDFFGGDDDDDPEDNGGTNDLQADPGSVWKLDGFKDVGQFQAANPDAYLKPFDRYVKAMAQATGIPFHFFDKQGERPPSGENIRQVNETLNSIVETRMMCIGGTHKSAFTFALNLLGHDVEKIKVVWRPIDVVTDLVGWQAINEKQLAGVPPEVTLVEAGYLESEVAPWKAEWDKQAEEAKQLQERELEQQQAFSSSSKVVHNSAARAMQRSTRTSNGTPLPGSGDSGTHGKKGQGA